MSARLDPLTKTTELKSLRFRKEREAAWTELEFLVDRFEKVGVRGLSNEDILAAPVLYRATLSALSVARATSLDKSLVKYLETLCARSYFFIYGARSTYGDTLRAFFGGGWSSAVRTVWKETLAAAMILMLGITAAFFLFQQSPDWYFSFVSSEMASGREPGASPAYLKSTLEGGGSADELLSFAVYLFVHNAGVSLLAFAIGFAFGLPTAFIIAFNGISIGMMMALFTSAGLGFEFIGWLSIHGVTELFSIILAGAGGFHIGRRLAFPGNQTRLAAVSEAGLVAGNVLAGCLIMLFVAGVLEGVGRQVIEATWMRYGIGLVTGLIWLVYFYAPILGRRTPQ